MYKLTFAIPWRGVDSIGKWLVPVFSRRVSGILVPRRHRPCQASRLQTRPTAVTSPPQTRDVYFRETSSLETRLLSRESAGVSAPNDPKSTGSVRFSSAYRQSPRTVAWPDGLHAPVPLPSAHDGPRRGPCRSCVTRRFPLSTRSRPGRAFKQRYNVLINTKQHVPMII